MSLHMYVLNYTDNVSIILLTDFLYHLFPRDDISDSGMKLSFFFLVHLLLLQQTFKIGGWMRRLL